MMTTHNAPMLRAAVLHGAGYVGRELIRLLHAHPLVELAQVTSRSHAGQPLHDAHPAFRGMIPGSFVDELSELDVDIVFIAAGHGRGADAVAKLLKQGYDGKIIDMSADFRLQSPELYEAVYGSEHPLPDLIPDFRYGLPEITGAHPPGTKYIANPGCFATGIALALHPLANIPSLRAVVTAMTGASGSGALASSTTHFPNRSGNVRAYRVHSHRHTPEVEQTLSLTGGIVFTPVSGPWTHGIWGTASVQIPYDLDVASAFASAYADAALIRLYQDELPELAPTVHSPFCDIGWISNGRELVIGFALDNLMKGAASQAIQNMNLLFDIDETVGLIPSTSSHIQPEHA